MAANEELLRLIDSIHRDKGIDKEYLFRSLEGAIRQASQKRLGTSNLKVTIDRMSGEIEAYEDGRRIDPATFGRIAAQTAKQVMIQKIREAESEVVYGEFEGKKGSLVTGLVQRIEHGSVIVNLGRTEALLPRQEQVFNEQYRAGDRIRAFMLDVKRQGQKVSIILSRAHPGLVEALFALEVPEISDRVVEIKNIVREAGHRTKVAVWSSDPRIDPVGSCVGMRGARIRSIVDELGGEKIDIIRWSDIPDVFIRNSLKPAEVSSVEFDREEMRARVVMPEDQLSLAIGRKGQNVRLTAKLTGWGIDILTEEESRQEKEFNAQEMQKLPGLAPEMVDRMVMAGFRSIAAIAKKPRTALAEVKGLSAEDIERIHAYALVRAKEIEAERAAAAEAAAAARMAGGAIDESLGEAAPAEDLTASPEEAGAGTQQEDEPRDVAGSDAAASGGAPGGEAAPQGAGQ
ncbi:MAG TPA: transcription termination factor NusA [Planctomycetota bacterium]|nr:transcription termination factor NusA [Planctomycetota bacterium]